MTNSIEKNGTWLIGYDKKLLLNDNTCHFTINSQEKYKSKVSHLIIYGKRALPISWFVGWCFKAMPASSAIECISARPLVQWC